MHVRGRLADRSPADILEWILSERKTGVLRFFDVRQEVRKDVWFDDGAVITSGSSEPREWLGQFLIAKGKITEEDFLRAYRTQEETKVLFGKVLAMIGLATEAEVKDALQEKTREAILDVFLWTDGYFEFEETPHELPDQRLPLQLDVERLIEEGETRQIEWGMIRQVFAGANVIPILDLARVQEATQLMDPRSKRMITLAATGKTVAEIAFDLHMPEFRVLHRFLEFHKKGIVKGGEVSEIQTIDADIEPLEDDQPMPEIQRPNPQQAGPSDEQMLAMIPILRRSPEELRAEQFSPEEGYLLSRVDGRYDLFSVLTVCPFPERLAMEVVKGLIDRGVISLQDPG